MKKSNIKIEKIRESDLLVKFKLTKKYLEITNKEMSFFFGMKNVTSFNNSSAKQRYITAFMRIKDFLIKNKWLKK